MKRSEIINLTQSLIVQGSIDPLWSNAEWSLMFDEAVDLFHEKLIESDLGFFIVRDQEIERIPEIMAWQLPADLHHILFAYDKSGEIQSADKEPEGAMTGYIVVDDKLRLVEWRDSPPDQVKIHYVKWPKELPDWDGGEDPDTEEYNLDYPFNTKRAGRVLARIIQVIAETKDSSLTQNQLSHASSIIDNYVDHLTSRTEDF